MKNYLNKIIILAFIFSFSFGIANANIFSNLISGIQNLGSNIPNIPIKNFLQLQDTPDSYSGQNGKVVLVNPTANALEFVATSSLGIIGGSGWTFSSSTIWQLFANTATGLTYNNTTGGTSLTSGYVIPLLASTTQWANLYNASTSFLTAETDPIWTATSSNYLTVVTAGTTYPTFAYASSTFPSFSYASSTYYLASNPSGYISSYTETDPIWIASSSAYLSTTTASTTYARLAGAAFTGDTSMPNTTVTNTATVNQLCFSGSALCMTAPSVSGTNVTLYFWNDASDIATYERLRTTPHNGTEISETATSSGGVYGLIDSYVSTTTDLSITNIPAGIWEFHDWANIDSNVGVSNIIHRIYKRSAGGTETLLFTATSTEMTTGIKEYMTDIVVGASTTMLTTDRIVIKNYIWSDSGPTRTGTYYYDGMDRYSHAHTPIDISVQGYTRASVNETITGSWTFSNTLQLATTTTSKLTVTGDTSLVNTTMANATSAQMVSNTSLSLKGTLLDSIASAGTNGLLLQSTGTSTLWVATTTLGFPVVTGTNTGDVTLVNNTNGLTISGQALTMGLAGTSATGTLSATDWNTFNNKGSGTVTAVSVATANGVSGSSSGGATPALTISLGAITPTTVTATGVISGANLSGTSTGSNTGDQTITLTGDMTGSGTGSITTTANLLCSQTTLTSDHTASGPRTTSLTGSTTVMDLVNFYSTGWYPSNANSSTTASSTGLLGISLATATTTQTSTIFTGPGCIRDDSWNYATGSTMYVGTSSAGVIINLAPQATGNVARIIGRMVGQNILYFNPSPDYVAF